MSYNQPSLPEPPPNNSSKPRRGKQTVSMSEKAEQLAEWAKEIYWLQTNRAARSQQVNLGPSELGELCENKLIRRLLNQTPANHGINDGWAATVGTAGHAWLAEAFGEYDSGRGRFLIEHGITIPVLSQDLIVKAREYAAQHDGPDHNWAVSGTLDLYDRKKRTVIDHKFLGKSTMDKLHATGEPEEKYQVQLMIYAYGLMLQGEQPEFVAVIAWPRVESTLSKLFVWVAPFDPEVAKKSLTRRERLVYSRLDKGEQDPEGLLTETPIHPSHMCTYCPFYKPYAVNIMDGCRGRHGGN